MSVTPEQARRERGGNGDARSHEERSPVELQQDIQRHRESIDQTLVELESKLSPGQLLDEGLRYVKTGPGEFLNNLGRAARDNPVPVALASVGLAWLMAAQRRGEGPSHAAAHSAYRAPQTADIGPQPGDEDVGQSYARYLSDEYPFEEEELECVIYEDLGPQAWESYTSRSGGGMREKAQHLKEGMGGAAARAGETAGNWAEQARTGIADLQAQAQQRMEAARQRMASAGDDLKQRMARAREMARQRMHSARSSAAGGTRAVARRGGEFFQHYPLSIIALGLAAGAALGTSLPRTRREDALLGERSDALKAQAAAAAREQGEHLRETASAAASAAAREAQAQGLSGEGMREQGQRLQEKAGHVMETAREESRRQGLSEEGLREGLRETREKVERVGAAARDAARQPHEPDKP